jgi:hypothetical protein
MVVPGDGDGGLDIGTSSITPALSPSGPSAITSVAGAPCRNPIPSSELPRRTAAHPTAKSARWSRYPKKETVEGAVASCATAGGGARRTVACSDDTAYGFSRIISLSLLDDAFFGGARMTNSYVSGWTAGHFVKQRGDEEERGRAPTTRSKRASGYGSRIYGEEIGRRRSSVSAVRSSRGRRFVRRGGPHVSLLKQRENKKRRRWSRPRRRKTQVG